MNRAATREVLIATVECARIDATVPAPAAAVARDEERHLSTA